MRDRFPLSARVAGSGLLLLALAACSPAARTPVEGPEDRGQPEPQVAPALIKEWESLIAQLGNDDYQKRQSAQKRLLDAGEKCLPLLETNMQHKDPEVRLRVREIRTALKIRGVQGDPSLFAEAMRAVALAVYYRYLPVYQ